MPINSGILSIHLLGSNHSDTKALPPTQLLKELTHLSISEGNNAPEIELIFHKELYKEHPQDL